MNPVKERNHLLDTIKGLAIILVVFGHCIQLGCGAEYIEQKSYWDNILFKIIYSFHMPLFALVSGYLMYPSMQRHVLAEYVKKQLLNIGLPIFSWSIIAISISIAQNGLGGAILYKKYYLLLMSDLWFLRVLLVDSLLMAVVVSVFKSMRSRMVAFGVILFLALLLPDVFHYNRVVYLLPYMVIGYACFPYLKNRENKKMAWWVVASSIIIFAVLMIGFKSEYIYSYPHSQTYLLAQGSSLQNIAHQLYVDGYRWLIGFAGCAMVVLLICKSVPNNNNLLSEIGKLSLPIYIISVELLNDSLVFITTSVTYNVLLVCIECVIIVTICIVITKLLCLNRHIGKILLGNSVAAMNNKE